LGLIDKSDPSLLRMEYSVRREKATFFSGSGNPPGNWSLQPVAIGAAVEEAEGPALRERSRRSL